MRRSGLVLLLALACQPALAAEPACKIARLAELPVTMVGTTPIVHALINGTDAAFVADSGAFFDMLTPAAVAEYKLPVKMAPWGLYIAGIGGEQQPDIATVKEFTILGLKIPNAVFLVAGNDLWGGAVGLLGQNAFRIADTEYDLANGVIRIMRPGECKSVGLAYWAAPGSYSEIDINRPTEQNPHIIGHAYLNGKKIVVLFDTGANTSVLSLDGAKRAGITPTSDGVVPAGANEGIGQHYVRTWIAPFHSFKIGDEEIRDTRLRIGEISNLASEAGHAARCRFLPVAPHLCRQEPGQAVLHLQRRTRIQPRLRLQGSWHAGRIDRRSLRPDPGEHHPAHRRRRIQPAGDGCL